MRAEVIATLGIIANLAGVILLFRYGMPYRIEGNYIGWPTTDAKGLRTERTFRLLGWSGLLLIVGGSAAQIVALFI